MLVWYARVLRSSTILSIFLQHCCIKFLFSTRINISLLLVSKSAMLSSSSAVFGLSASDGYPEEYRLLELTPEIVAQLESQSPTSTSNLRVRGRATDVATLIDLEDNAYNLHTSHTSNNLYLLTTEPATEPQGFSALVLRSKTNQTLELQKIRPQIRARVVEVLQWDERGPFRGTEFDQQRMDETTPPQLRSSEEHGRGEQWGSVQIPTSLVRDMAYASTPIDANLLYSTGGVSFHSTLLNPLFRSSLPNEPRSRLQRLFEIKPRWSRSEVRPFLEDLVDVDLDLLETGDEKTFLAAGKTIDTWLIKFGRGVKSSSGEMVYSSRVN
ncbi:hypothetical protein BX661DRAFT_41729 [Kickxella alabastrina]|uniref:uncharacterized protein n=1 Tax=Kickxella alabastrina TaxID=61397 RepID=UPI002220CDD6|nr:uncharacterized protein BX661DRAFT_41729 [Kickxella alabastrina]KAI7824947.1 hypothetical protein BX661DRAFT_41729 [Kickxella alabastrina]